MEITPSPLAKPGLMRPVAEPRPEVAPWRRPRQRSGRELAMESSAEAQGTRMRLAGSLTARTSMPFKQAVATLAQQARFLLIDLKEVPHLDPTGLAALAEAMEIGRRQGCRVVVTNVPQGARRLIAQASLHKVIELGE